jgi:hypothetical protein
MTYTYTRMQTNVLEVICVSVFIHVCILICLSAYVHTYMDRYICSSLYIFTYPFIYIYKYAYITVYFSLLLFILFRLHYFQSHVILVIIVTILTTLIIIYMATIRNLHIIACYVYVSCISLISLSHVFLDESICSTYACRE